jgi:chaperonin GroES
MATALKTTLKPLGNRVIAKRVEEEEKTASGIIIPDSAKDKHKQLKAKVIAVGSGKRLDNGTTVEIPVQVGDTILMDEYSGQEVTVDNDELIILKADDIMAIIEG